MRVKVSRLLALAVLALAVPAGADPGRDAATSWAGVWRNTNNTVHIKAAPCGAAMCATVVWADAQTTATVAAKGRKIVGMQLLRDFRQTAPSEWKGTVYVPDMDITVAGRMTMLDRNRLRAVGCGFLGLVCQTRHWQRIS